MKFEKLRKEDIVTLLPWLRRQNTHISNYSAAFLFMWHRHQNAWFATVGDCLILREQFVKMPYFYYPISLSGSEEEERAAISALEEYCRENKERLHFTNVPKNKLCELVPRYGADVHISNLRKWRDFLYRTEDFRNFAGGKYSGQRNHINKFRKNYPDAQMYPFRQEDVGEVLKFLDEYSAVQLSKDTFLAKEELRAVREVLPFIEKLDLVGAYVRIGGKIVSFVIGEKCGDMMIVVVEKALREYEGIYPATAQMFAKTFCGEEIEYLNREDDAGDLGLRKSKMQYLPCELVDKYNLAIHRPIDTLSKFPEIRTQRLVLKKIGKEDTAEYARLARDEELNRYWGYDWKKDAPEDVADEWFLKDVYTDFKNKDEIRLGIYSEGTLIGEATLYNFGYRAEAEFGVRVSKEYQGRGFAKEAAIGLCGYGFSVLNLERIEAKCYKPNQPSAKMLQASGMRPCGEDETFLYFYKTAAM